MSEKLRFFFEKAVGYTKIKDYGETNKVYAKSTYDNTPKLI